MLQEKEGVLLKGKDQVFYNEIQIWYAIAHSQKSINVINAWHVQRMSQKLQETPEKDLECIHSPLAKIIAQRSPPKMPILKASDPLLATAPFSILEGLSATGLRSIRYAKEIPHVKSILANDLDPEAVAAIQENIQLNQVQDLVQAHQGNATHVLYEAIMKNQKFDVIDLDPYGSAVPFIDAAVQAVSEGGLLCITCTDMAVLAGSQSETCWSKYGGMSLPNSPFTHELGLRILLQTIQNSAARYKRAIEPLLSCSIDFYARVFVRVRTSPATVKLAASQSSIVYYCAGCKNTVSHSVGKYIESTAAKGTKSQKFGPGRGPGVDKDCQLCNGPFHMGGPFYSGPIHSSLFMDVLLRQLASTPETAFGTRQRMIGMLSVISEELDVPFYYTASSLANSMRCTTPPMDVITSALLNAGYEVSQSHASPGSLKTSAPVQVLYDIYKVWCQENAPIQESNLKKGSPAFQLFQLPLVTMVNLKKHPRATSLSKRFKVVRYQANPTAFWGPKARPRKRKAEEKP